MSEKAICMQTVNSPLPSDKWMKDFNYLKMFKNVTELAVWLISIKALRINSADCLGRK